MEEQEQVAPEETNEGTSVPEVTSQAPGASEVTDTQPDVQRVPAQETSVTEQVSVNWQEKYQKLMERAGITKEDEAENYRLLRKKLVEQGTEKNSFKKKLDAVEAQLKQFGETFAKAVKEPYNPDKFMEELRAKGPAVFEDTIKQMQDQIQAKYEGELTNLRSEIQADRAERQAEKTVTYVEKARSDAKNYPGFKDLEPTMVQMLNDMREDFQAGVLEVDPDTVDRSELVDYLYKQSKLKHSEQAIVKAKELGKAEATQELAREASTAVAGGGKGSLPKSVDINAMTAAQYKEYARKAGIVED